MLALTAYTYWMFAGGETNQNRNRDAPPNQNQVAQNAQIAQNLNQ